MNGFVSSELESLLDIGGWGSFMKGSSSRSCLNSMKSSTAEESVPRNGCPLANTEQSGLILKGKSVFASFSEDEVQ